MNKLLTICALLLFVCTFPIMAGAQTGHLPVLEAKVAAFSADGLATRDMATRQDYSHGVVIPYFATHDHWWTGLAVTNESDSTAEFSIGCLDVNGAVVASGTFTLPGEALTAHLIDGFIGMGTVPGRGQIAIFSDQAFVVDRYLGNEWGGYGDWIFNSQAY